MQQAQLQVTAARSGLEEALQRLHRLRQQLQDSSSVVENTNVTVEATNQLMGHTHRAGSSIVNIKNRFNQSHSCESKLCLHVLLRFFGQVTCLFSPQGGSVSHFEGQTSVVVPGEDEVTSCF